MMMPPTIDASTRSRSVTGRPSEAASFSVTDARVASVESDGGRDVGHDDAALLLGDLAEDARDVAEQIRCDLGPPRV